MRPVMIPRRLNRAALLRSTALQAVVGLVLATPALAQPAPNARPFGGQVVAGSASIANTARATTITQSTNRAAIDWRGFDVGSQQTVTFRQPASNSVTLNRVTGGDPSAIAGRISANGQIVLTNRSGVTFHQGAQVDAQSVIVSAADISNQNFMAGRMVFDRAANPNARVENRGAITVRQAGLAALVAPSVANSGVIDARLGQVVLAGGAVAHTLDMYGDGLVSIDVTRQVVQVPMGSDGKAVTALVTNTGIIAADGGVVRLTATAADGVVQTLVRAGGLIRANTVGDRTGRIEVAGTGGSVVIEGRLAADGRVGGEIMVAGSDVTVIAPSARVTANGHTGGGTIALGTTLARARGTGAAPAGTSARTLIASGAHVSADATASGNGGRITVLSTRHTSMDGALTARGGKSGGDGGTIEMSGELGFSLAGTADTSALHGASGTIVLDPRDLTISTAGANNIAPGAVDPNIAYSDGGIGADAFVTPAQIQALTGTVHLQATRDLTVASPVAYGNGSLILEAGNNLTVNAGVTLIGGSLSLLAGSSAIPGFAPTGALTVNAAISANSLTLQAGAIALNANVTANVLSVNTPGTLTQSAGSLTAATLEGNAGSVSLTSRANAVAGLANGFSTFQVTGASGDFILVDSVPLTVGSPSVPGGVSVHSGGTITLQTDSLTLDGRVITKVLETLGGTIVLTPFTTGTDVLLTSGAKLAGSLSLTTTELGETSAATLKLGALDAANVPTARNIVLGQAGETINLAANGGYTALSLLASGDVTQGGPLTVATLSGQAGSLSLANTGNSVRNLAGFRTTAGNLALSTRSGLTVSGAVIANGGVGDVTLAATGNVAGTDSNMSMSLTGDVTGATVSLSTVAFGSPSTSGGISQTGGVITAATLTGGGRFASLGDNNLIQRLGAFHTSDGLLVQTTLPLSVTGAVLSEQGTITLNANGLTQTAGSSISAFELDGTSTAATVLNNGSNGIQSIGAFTQTGGDLAITSNVASLGFGVNNTVVSGTGSLSFTADAVGLFSLNGITTPGTVSFAPLTAGRRMELIGGSAADPNSLSLNQAFLNSIQAGTLQLGAAGASGPINIANLGETVTLAGIAGTLNLLTSGAVTQGGSGALIVETSLATPVA